LRKTVDSVKTIILTGASLTTGNMGVSALAWSSINLINQRWPDTDIAILGDGRAPSAGSVDLEGQSKEFRTWPVRYCLNPFKANHILLLTLVTYLIHWFPRLAAIWSQRETTLGAICRADIFLDITGGDSFSDIYGMKRMVMDYLLKRVCQVIRKPFVLLPQTYGPFKSQISRFMARQVFLNSDLIVARDSDSMVLVKDIVPSIESDKCVITPDVAFTLDPHPVDNALLSRIRAIKREGNTVVGFNISGLLYHNGYTGRNEFGLTLEYEQLVKTLAAKFALMDNVKVLLVPHVVPDSPEASVENDMLASEDVYASLDPEVAEHVILAQGDYDQCSVKYLIGQCDFFLGSRMHSTIAALSQMIPTVGLAYSKKFSGVYQTIGMESCVLDLRTMSTREILDQILSLYSQRHELRKQLSVSIPRAKEQVLSFLDYVKT